MITETQQASMTEAQKCRVHLRDALHVLEEAVSSPVPGREEQWRAAVRDRLQDLQRSLAGHISVTEGLDGLLPQIEIDAPRLENRIARLRREHVRINDLIGEAMHAVDDPRIAPDDIRLLVGAIHSALLRHRQLGADLVYEAYEVDIGGGED
jgi:hypothetical protein